jgi:hypothetical protein
MVHSRDALPVRLFLLKRRYPQKLIDSRLRIFALDLLRVVVFVLDVHVAALFFVVVLILKVIPGID